MVDTVVEVWERGRNWRWWRESRGEQRIAKRRREETRTMDPGVEAVDKKEGRQGRRDGETKGESKRMDGRTGPGASAM